MGNERILDYLVVHDGEIVADSLYAKDARTAATKFVKSKPGARVRIFRGEETIYSFVAVDDDLPKAAKDQP